MLNNTSNISLSTEIYNAWQQSTKENKEMESNGKEKENWEIQDKMGSDDGQRKVKFHSKAKQGSDEAYLSNFQGGGDQRSAVHFSRTLLPVHEIQTTGQGNVQGSRRRIAASKTGQVGWDQRCHA